MWPRLVNGSVIHLMDCFKHQLTMFFTLFVADGSVECVSAAFGAAPWSFVVRKAPLDWDRVRGFMPGLPLRPAVAVLMHKTVDALVRQLQVPEAAGRALHERIVAEKEAKRKIQKRPPRQPAPPVEDPLANGMPGSQD